MKVGVIGLGELGIANVAVLSSFGHEIVAYDSNAFLVSLVKRKVRVIKDNKTRKIIDDNVNRIFYTSTINDLLPCELIVIAVDLNIKEGKYNLDDFYEIIDSIKEMHGERTILIRTPIPYSTSNAIEKYFGESKGTFHIAYEPVAIIDDLNFDSLLSSPLIVVGTTSEIAHLKVLLLYENRLLNGTKMYFVSCEEAEFYRIAITNKNIAQKLYIANLRTLCNDYSCNFDNIIALLKHDMNISYKLELGSNYKTVLEYNNIDFFLRKDYNLYLGVIDNNRLLANQILKLIKGEKSIGIFGISDNNGDLHPLILEFIKLLLINNCQVTVFDNRNEENLKKLVTSKNLKYALDPKSLIKKANAILFLTDTEDYSLIKEDFYLKYGNENTIVYDFVSAYNYEQWNHVRLVKMYEWDKVIYKNKEKASQL